MQSMTKQQQRIIQEIARYLLENPKEKQIKMKQLLQICVEKMIQQTSKQLKEQLSEAKDHKVVIEKLDENGNIVFSMNYPAYLLEKIVNIDTS